MSSQHRSPPRFAPPLFLSALSLVIAGAAFAGCSRGRDSGGAASLYRNVPSVYSLLLSSYLHRNRIPSDPDVFGSVDDLLTDLNDPFTYERDLSAQANADQGQFSGAKGITVATIATQVYVARVDAGGPAWREGLRPNDILVAVDGTPVDANTPSLGQVLAPPTITLDVRRAGQPLRFTVTAETFTSVAVVDSAIDAATHYVSIAQFFSQTLDPDGPAGELRAIVAANPQVTRWIIDVRHNGGGSLERACEIVDLFVSAGTTVELADWTGLVSFSCAAMPGDAAESTQVAVVMNGSSASASEVLAAALRDLRSAPLIGSRSYGKGVAQLPFDYIDDPRQLLLVTHRVTGPSGSSWNEVGLSPDVDAPLDVALLEAGRDSQVQAAIDALNASAVQPARRSLPPRGPVVGPGALRDFR